MARNLGSTRYTEFKRMMFTLYATIIILDAQLFTDAKFGSQVKHGLYVDNAKVRCAALEEKEQEMEEWRINDLLVMPKLNEIDPSEYTDMSFAEVEQEYISYSTNGNTFSKTSKCYKVCITGVEISLNDLNNLSYEKEGRTSFKLNALLEDTSGTGLDIVIWNNQAESIMGVSFAEFTALNEAERGKKINKLHKQQYTVYIATQVNDFNNTLRAHIKKIEIEE